MVVKINYLVGTMVSCFRTCLVVLSSSIVKRHRERWGPEAHKAGRKASTCFTSPITEVQYMVARY
jgi:hypothetical protein